jgi:Cof subfamily protein (haloacid dehalogenase superfamily)
MMHPVDIVFTDMDGTLLDDSYAVSQANRSAFERLGRLGIVRAVATGRSLYAVRRRLPLDFPVDYVVCSSGAGVVDWRNQQLLRSVNLPAPRVREIAGMLVRDQVAFMLHAPLPDNEFFVYHECPLPPVDLQLRVDYYKDCASPFDGQVGALGDASQFLILPRSLEHYGEIAARLPDGVTAIRASSPFVKENIWMEVFDSSVSKAAAAAWLVERLGISKSRTMSIGNDYNDAALLEWTTHSFLVENAPEAMKAAGHRPVLSNNQSGVAEAIRQILEGI